MLEFKGSVIWARQTVESDIFFWKPDKWFKIWFYLVCRVNFKDTKQFKRGSCFTTYKEISDNTKATKDQIKHCLSYLKDAQMIHTQKATRGMIVSVLRYAEYQDAIKSKSHSKSHKGATEKPQRSHTIVEECNNEKKSSITPKISKRLVDSLIGMADLQQGPDGDYQLGNLFPAKKLAKNIKQEISPDKDMTDDEIIKGFERLYDKMDDFHRNNATSIGYIVKNWNKIINTLK